MPAAAIQALEVIEGAPPAEYGDKTSLVIVGTTRSGQGVTRPTGTLTLDYGTFGSSNAALDVAYGGAKWGNFVAVSGLESGRFLDAPEFRVYHDRGNEENFFDRFDYQLSDVSSVHTNFQYTRSWFQTPNSYDIAIQLRPDPDRYGTVGSAGRRFQTIDIAPTYTRTVNSSTVLNFAPYLRHDSYLYTPSNNPLDDLGQGVQGPAGDCRAASLAHQRRRPLRYFVRQGCQQHQAWRPVLADVRARERYAWRHRCQPEPGLLQRHGKSHSEPGAVQRNDNTEPELSAGARALQPDRWGSTYLFHGQTDVKQLALYGQDQITAGHWLFNLGIRGDIYNGLAIQRQAEPRVGLSYNFAKTGTVLRASYARTQETPFNENLVLSSQGCLNPVVAGIFTATYGYCTPAPFNPGFRNEFHVGFAQNIGHHFVLNAEYITKYTHNAYDFSILGNTPITFPIEWHNSKIPGFTLAGTLAEVKGFSARVTMSSVAARFFNPQVGGVGATIAQAGVNYPFRIDHDERFNQTTHIEYKMPFRKSLYYSMNWKFDSGLVAGSAPCFNVTDPNSICGSTSILINGQPGIDLSAFTPDQQFAGGFLCNGVKATVNSGFSQCLASQFSSSLIKVPAPGTEDDDRNPQRIAPRNLFDMAFGDDKITSFRQDRYQLGARVTAINLTDKYALYNYLSTFSGTHYVSPRTVTGEIALHF